MSHTSDFYGSNKYVVGNPPYDPWNLLFEPTGDRPPGRLEDMSPMSSEESGGRLSPREAADLEYAREFARVSPPSMRSRLRRSFA